MKKTYAKPEIAFESFSLSQNIAAGCEYTDPRHQDLYFTGLGYAFTTGCEVDFSTGGGDGEYNGICYHVPTDVNLFTS